MTQLTETVPSTDIQDDNITQLMLDALKLEIYILEEVLKVANKRGDASIEALEMKLQILRGDI